MTVDSCDLLGIIWIRPTSAMPIYYAKNGAGGICVSHRPLRDSEIVSVVRLSDLIYKRVNIRA